MKFHIYKDARGEWRWRLKAANGKVIATAQNNPVKTALSW